MKKSLSWALQGIATCGLVAGAVAWDRMNHTPVYKLSPAEKAEMDAVFDAPCPPELEGTDAAATGVCAAMVASDERAAAEQARARAEESAERARRIEERVRRLENTASNAEMRLLDAEVRAAEADEVIARVESSAAAAELDGQP